MDTEIKNTNVNVLKAHLAINVKDVSSSIEFYKKMFGIEPSKVRTGYAKFDVHKPPLNFTLNQVPFDGAGALSHLGVQVGSSEDVATMKSFWEAQGLTAREELKTDCCYAVQDKAWVTDITYIRTQEGFAYLAVVIDLFSRRVIGWSLQSRQVTDVVLQALLMAVWRRKPKSSVLVHSDSK